MTEVLRKMLVAGAAVAALSVAACGQPAENTADTNTEVAAEVVANDAAAVANDAAAVANDAAAVTNDAAAATNDAAAATNAAAE